MLGSALGSNLDILYLLAATNAQKRIAHPHDSAGAARRRVQPTTPAADRDIVAVCANAGNISSLGYPPSAALSRQ